jgi:circadian clock protein KaiB
MPKATKRVAKSRQAPNGRSRPWKLRLYVAGETPRSVAAIENLKRICADHMPERYEIEVVDLVENPKLARDDQVLAIPTLVRHIPPPLKKIIGDLSNVERVLVGLDVIKSSSIVR